MKLAAIQKVKRYAIVGGQDWRRKAIKTANSVCKDRDRRTMEDQESERWAWLGVKLAQYAIYGFLFSDYIGLIDKILSC
ncbi:MAG: hypothetical protein R3B95_11235 [Nitrospirales bacterium]|nr:hypothetical protein [Nitrospirales bacterium]